MAEQIPVDEDMKTGKSGLYGGQAAETARAGKNWNPSKPDGVADQARYVGPFGFADIALYSAFGDEAAEFHRLVIAANSSAIGDERHVLQEIRCACRMLGVPGAMTMLVDLGSREGCKRAVEYFAISGHSFELSEPPPRPGARSAETGVQENHTYLPHLAAPASTRRGSSKLSPPPDASSFSLISSAQPAAVPSAVTRTS